MKRTIQVLLGDEARLVGTLHYDVRGARESAAFTYADEWLAAKDGFALEPGLPLVAGPQFHRKIAQGSIFHAAFADTEPDGWGRRVLQRDHAKRRQSDRKAGKAVDPAPLNAMDFLLAVDDASRVGALRFRDEAGVLCRASDPGRRTAPPFLELGHLINASRAVELEKETAADLAYLRGRGTSLGGLRPKCTIVDAKGRLAIGKFPSVQDERAVTKGEVLAMQLARTAGINVADTQLVDSDGVPVTVVRRFDRTPDGKRMMYVSAATLVGVEATDSAEHAYTEMVDALRQHGAAVQEDVEELWRRMAFSILVSNFDDHLHNHGFLHVDHGLWRLSPAFDINPFPDRTRELKTWISPDTGPEATIAALMSVTAYFRIKPVRARVILREVDRAIGSWRKVGQSLGMTAKELEAFSDAFEHPERAAAKKAYTAG
jgi:serine/threonine-protein kinase HipA